MADDLLNIYPPDVDTNAEKVCYARRTMDLLRLEHNTMSCWFNCGLTRDEYDNGLVTDCKDDSELCCGVNELTILGDNIKAQYPYKPQLTEAEMISYIRNSWMPRSSRATSDFAKYRTLCLKDPACRSVYFKTVQGPDGDELNFDKAHADIAATSAYWPYPIDGISIDK